MGFDLNWGQSEAIFSGGSELLGPYFPIFCDAYPRQPSSPMVGADGKIQLS
jgi:hypothetical protein